MFAPSLLVGFQGLRTASSALGVTNASFLWVSASEGAFTSALY
jgi:hypothetical protein